MAILKMNDLKRRKPFIDLNTHQGNAFFLIGVVRTLSKKYKKDAEEIIARMQSGDYENLLFVFDSEFGEYIDLYR